MIKLMAVVAVIALAGCGGEELAEPATAPEPEPSAEPEQPPEPDPPAEPEQRAETAPPTEPEPDESDPPGPCTPLGNEMYVDASCIDPWPLTTSDGVLRCEPPDSVTIDSGGTRYAVNGMASTHGDGVEIDPIWSDNPEIDGLKIDIGGLIDAGLELC